MRRTWLLVTGRTKVSYQTLQHLLSSHYSHVSTSLFVITVFGHVFINSFCWLLMWRDCKMLVLDLGELHVNTERPPNRNSVTVPVRITSRGCWLFEVNGYWINLKFVMLDVTYVMKEYTFLCRCFPKVVFGEFTIECYSQRERCMWQLSLSFHWHLLCNVEHSVFNE